MSVASSAEEEGLSEEGEEEDVCCGLFYRDCGCYWVGYHLQLALRIAVLGAALVNCLIFPTQLAFMGPMGYEAQPGWAATYLVMDVLLWLDVLATFFTQVVLDTTITLTVTLMVAL